MFTWWSEFNKTLKNCLFNRNNFSIFFFVYLALKQLINKKQFLVKKNPLGFYESIFFILSGKYFSDSCKKFKNTLLFINYIKFDP
jgi:hypothetical protein